LIAAGFSEVLLHDLQKLLGGVYGIDLTVDIYDFLVTDPALLQGLTPANTTRTTTEKLLIQQQDDELGLSLYLDSELLDRLKNFDPRHWLGDMNLADFCTVLEGISHFNYVAWNAAADKSVTLMELELQAEVDKYIGARVLVHQQPQNDLLESLFARLFDRHRFHVELAPEELARYKNASNFAGRYCRSLEKRFPQEELGTDMVQDLRAFYRLPQPDKLSFIHSAFFA